MVRSNWERRRSRSLAARRAVRTDTPIRSASLKGKQEAGAAADQDGFPRPPDRLDQLRKMVEIRFLRGIVLLTKRKQPVLNNAGGELVEAPDLIDRQSHPVGDRLEQFAVIDFPAQSLADQPGDRTSASAGFPADADILEPRHRAHGILRLAILLALSQEPANQGPWPVPEARDAPVLGFGRRACEPLPRRHGRISSDIH